MIAALVVLTVVVVLVMRSRRRKGARTTSTDALIDVLDMAVYRGQRWRPKTKKGRWWL